MSKHRFEIIEWATTISIIERDNFDEQVGMLVIYKEDFSKLMKELNGFQKRAGMKPYKPKP